jgi:ketosteroid isomerase-like protein
MTVNQSTIERYMEGFRRNDHSMILSCLTEDVEWVVPGAFFVTGKDAFDKEIEGEGFVDAPTSVVTRYFEDRDVVIAEGFVHTRKEDGTLVNLAMCDVFDMHEGKIRRLTSYLMPVG